MYFVLLVNVRYLQTGHVSLQYQYHCDFDIFFETIFSSKLDTRTLDKCFDEIFQDSCDWYAK